jgi:SPP1 family predicted phage head-tail adaptor
MLAAGRLRHRVTFLAPTKIQDPVSGDMLITWANVWTNIAAEIAPLSAKEFIAAQAMQAQTVARITIRVLPELTAQHRVRHGDTIYSIDGPPLRDNESGREYMTLLVSEVDDSEGAAGATADSSTVTADSDQYTADAA